MTGRDSLPSISHPSSICSRDYNPPWRLISKLGSVLFLTAGDILMRKPQTENTNWATGDSRVYLSTTSRLGCHRDGPRMRLKARNAGNPECNRNLTMRHGGRQEGCQCCFGMGFPHSVDGSTRNYQITTMHQMGRVCPMPKPDTTESVLGQ